ncbi:ubiquitin-associated and SH3 domain-containing protein B-like [Ptychodera flava]|uniref:ubiquitin-associated and SH3 domain-containing protein B-like n=1 Tax=Ptychodera flava TaxID=63121 RepID=UPI003969E6FB
MAARLPTRRRSEDAATIKKNLSSLQILMNMGFSKHRVEKALAATGNKGVQLASDWLLSHVHDPELDQRLPREYVLYACPAGDIGVQLNDFWDRSLAQCGRNSAHNLFPHVTLCSFFKCEDSNVAHLEHALQKAVDKYQSYSPENVLLEYFDSPNYIGLFLDDKSADFMRQVCQDFAVEADKLSGTKIEPHKKQLHLTLAYQFHSSHFDVLVKLSKELDFKGPARWEFRLYSRDPRIAKAEVLRVLYSHTPRSPDELELISDDYIFMSSAEYQNSSDGWFEGTSWLTGCSGVFPGNYTEKTAESDTWTLHRVLPLTRTKSGSGQNVSPSPILAELLCGSDESRGSKYNSPEGLLTEPLYAKVHKQKKPNVVNSSEQTKKEPRKLFIMRHAERVDITFGQQWLKYCFDLSGKYTRKNLNMPRTVPQRQGGPKSFNKDSPITEIGLFQARLTGEAMRDEGITVKHVFSSSALRCVQTADAILQGIGADDSVKIRVDAGLFEWLAWSPLGIPNWMTPSDMAACGLRVDTEYKPFVTVHQLDPKEKCEQYYKRSHIFTQNVLKLCEKEGGNVLLVGHAGTLDGCSRQLTGLSYRNPTEFTKIVQKIPYCGVVTLEEIQGTGIWDLIQTPFPTLTHGPNPRFDWRILRN